MKQSNNIESFLENINYKLIEGDIRDLKNRQMAVADEYFMLH